jgi:hypothetical protein
MQDFPGDGVYDYELCRIHYAKEMPKLKPVPYVSLNYVPFFEKTPKLDKTEMAFEQNRYSGRYPHYLFKVFVLKSPLEPSGCLAVHYDESVYDKAIVETFLSFYEAELMGLSKL